MFCHPSNLCFFLVLAAVFTVSSCSPSQYETRAQSQVDNLALGLRAFHLTYGYYPKVSDDQKNISSSLVVAALLSDSSNEDALKSNHRKIRFVDFPSSQLPEGIPVDPWKSPYQFLFDDDNSGTIQLGERIIEASIVVWSYGKNRINEYGLGDDIISHVR